MSTRIVIVVRGGIVQGVWSDVKDLEVAIYDHDSINDDPECRPDEWATAVVEEDTAGFELVY